MRYTGNTNGVVTIKCPFFMAETEKSINCEGLESSSKNSMWFKNELLKDNYIRKHCMDYPNGCPLAEGLLRKYEE